MIEWVMGLVGAALLTGLYVLAVAIFGFRPLPPSLGVDAYRGGVQLFAISLSAPLLLLAGTIRFALGFRLTRR